MSSNIKFNPFDLVGTWNDAGLDYVIANAPSSPTILQLAEVIADFAVTKFYNASLSADLDKMLPIGLIADTINFMSANSWCADCCDNTFKSFDKIKAMINSVSGYEPIQTTYINQLLSMPCNPAINVTDFSSAISQLETSVIIDNVMSIPQKNQLLEVIAISKYSLKYWIARTSGVTPWAPYLTPLPPADYIRPFWLAGLIGSIITTGGAINETPLNYTNMSVYSLTGSLAGSSFYAIFKG
jgi:hypothetical protein